MCESTTVDINNQHKVTLIALQYFLKWGGKGIVTYNIYHICMYICRYIAVVANQICYSPFFLYETQRCTTSDLSANNPHNHICYGYQLQLWQIEELKKRKINIWINTKSTPYKSRLQTHKKKLHNCITVCRQLHVKKSHWVNWTKVNLNFVAKNGKVSSNVKTKKIIFELLASANFKFILFFFVINIQLLSNEYVMDLYMHVFEYWRHYFQILLSAIITLFRARNHL